MTEIKKINRLVVIQREKDGWFYGYFDYTPLLCLATRWDNKESAETFLSVITQPSPVRVKHIEELKNG